jgi:hypothetical protein
MPRFPSKTFTGLAAGALVALAFSASTAGASSGSIGPTKVTCRPSFSATQSAFWVTISGSCFPAGSRVRVKFSLTTAFTPTATVRASSTGSFTDPNHNCFGSTRTAKVTVRDLKSGWHRTRSVTVPACKLP